MKQSGSHSTVGRVDLGGLRSAIEEVELRSSRLFAPAPVAPVGWGAVDRALGGGLACGAVHEWFGLMGGERRGCRVWLPPIGVLSHLASRSLTAGGGVAGEGGLVLWIGRRCWPYPRSLRGRWGARLLARSIFVEAGDIDERVWAMDLALRCRAVAAVVGDGSGLNMAESRRLQLAAGAGGVLGLLARPVCELGEISAARTRWRVSPTPSPVALPRWSVELLHSKGAMLPPEEARCWVVQRDDATGSLGLVPDALDRSLTPSGRATLHEPGRPARAPTRRSA